VFQTDLFNTSSSVRIADKTEIIFVADMFSETYSGGAELSSDALITSSPFVVQKVLSKDLDLKVLEQGVEKFWIFGNFANMDPQLIPSIIANLNYSVVEYDYKYCRYRSTEKHESNEMTPCACHDENNGKMISAFYYGAKALWWMSEGQMNHYHNLFPFLAEKPNTVLSSIFDDKTFVNIKILREFHKANSTERKKWIVLGSSSWVKGADQAEQYCKDNNLDYDVVFGLSYDEALARLSSAKGFVYLPNGKDTCPRMVIEAKLLGCELVLNENVQHKDEDWFTTDSVTEIEEYLYAARKLFWDGIKSSRNWKPTISGYTTTKDCISAGYPWKQSILSMMGFCDEVVVVDGGSTDGTWEELEKWSASISTLKIKQIKRDWSSPRFAVFDGLQKAEARKLCVSNFCWQQDADEIVHENDYEKILGLAKGFPAHADLVSLPVIEYWGKNEKVRLDVNPWKWRISRNKQNITHGIPGALRAYDDNNELYSLEGSDGCDYIDANSFKVIPHASFYNMEAHTLRLRALDGDAEALRVYTQWFTNISNVFPGVHHYSWRDIDRKIKTYRDYWSSHWQSLYNVTQEDTAENNMFFQRPWSEVTDVDIAIMARMLEEKMGGWVFHNPVDFSKPTPSMIVECGHPKIMR
jgi:glycosyltransferase involved in cell wall biosynthesis